MAKINKLLSAAAGVLISLEVTQLNKRTVYAYSTVGSLKKFTADYDGDPVLR